MMVPTVRRNRRHMEYKALIFWLVCFSSVTGLVGALRRVRTAGPGWAVLFLLILAICLAGWSWQQPSLVYASGALWFLFVVVPGLLGKLYFRRFLEQRYPEARRLARIISWLHPADGWRQQPGLVHAVELAQRGELAAASAALERYRETKSLVGLIAMTMLYRISHRWEQLIAWETRHRDELERFPQFLHVALRARRDAQTRIHDRHHAQLLLHGDMGEIDSQARPIRLRLSGLVVVDLHHDPQRRHERASWRVMAVGPVRVADPIEAHVGSWRAWIDPWMEREQALSVAASGGPAFSVHARNDLTLDHPVVVALRRQGPALASGGLHVQRDFMRAEIPFDPHPENNRGLFAFLDAMGEISGYVPSRSVGAGRGRVSVIRDTG